MTADRFEFTIHVRPGASRDGVDGQFDGVLAVRVSAPASGGEANAAVRRALAAAFDVRPTAVEITNGARGRRKRIAIAGDRTQLAGRHEQLMTS